MAIQIIPKDIDDIIEQIEKLQQLAKVGAEKSKKQAGSLTHREQKQLKQFEDYKRILSEVKQDELLLKSGQPGAQNLRRLIKLQKAKLESIKPSYDAVLLHQLKQKSQKAKRNYDKVLRNYFGENVKRLWETLDIFLYAHKEALGLLDYQIVNQIQGLLDVKKCQIASDEQFEDVTLKLRKIKARLELERQQQPVVQKPAGAGQGKPDKRPRKSKIKTSPETPSLSKPLFQTKWMVIFGVSRSTIRRWIQDKSPDRKYHFVPVSSRKWALPKNELPAEYLSRYQSP